MANIQSGKRPIRNKIPDRTFIRKGLIAFYGSTDYTVVPRANGKEIGKVVFDAKAIGQLARYVETDAEYAAAKAAPAVIKNGILVDHHTLHKGRGNITDSYTYAAPVILNGKRGNEGVVVHHTNRNKPHAVRIVCPDGSGFVLDIDKSSPYYREADKNADRLRLSEAAFNDSKPQTGETVKDSPVPQAVSPAKTSIKQVPALFKDKNVSFGKENIDIGGGKYDLATDYLATIGTKNRVFDPYNRGEDVNTETLAYLQSGKRADTATCANVLNVIAEPAARANVILEAAKAIKHDGKAYFMVYEGDGSGTGRETAAGWQNNRKTTEYVDEIQQYFDDVERKGKLIVATSPSANLPKASWEVQPGKAMLFSRADTPATTEKDVEAIMQENEGLQDAYAILRSLFADVRSSVTQKDIDSIASKIIKEYGSTFDKKELSDLLGVMFSYPGAEKPSTGRFFALRARAFRVPSSFAPTKKPPMGGLFWLTDSV